jgi:DNA-binding PadR family transcriptional regulator
LLRLEQKGLVSCRLGNPTAERGGRAKKYFEATEQGVREARQTQRALTGLWRGVRQLKEGTA